MLLKQTEIPKIDYMENWPSRYYEIPGAAEKKACLETAIEKKLDPVYDPYRMKLLEKRYFFDERGKKTKKAVADRFMHSWAMIKASSAMDYKSFLRKKRAEKELLSYMRDLCLLDYEAESPEEKQVLVDEWTDFATRFIVESAGNRTYGSALFGIIPIGDKNIARKMVSDINLITRDYPAEFGLEQNFLALRRILVDVYCAKIENGASYWI